MSDPIDPTAPKDAPPPAARGRKRRIKSKRSGSETRDKAYLVTSRYAKSEYEQLEKAASKAGLTRASYQRKQSLETEPKTRSTRRPHVDHAMLSTALGQLGRVGGNLNQVARAANIDGAQRYEVMETVAEVRALLPLFMAVLGRKL